MRYSNFTKSAALSTMLLSLLFASSCASKQGSTSSSPTNSNLTNERTKRPNSTPTKNANKTVAQPESSTVQEPKEDPDAELQRLIEEAELEEFVYIVSALGKGRDSKVKELFWRALLADPAHPSLAKAAAAELRALGRPTASLDPGIASALALGETQGKLRNGEIFDYSAGKPKLPPRAKSSIQVTTGRGTVFAGETMDFNVQVSNTGKGNLFKVLGVVRCSIPDVDGAEIYFGKIPPGNTAKRKLALAIPSTLAGQSVELTVQFKEANDYVPAPLKALVNIEAAPRPVLAIWSRAVDDDGAERAVGNGDGLVQKGESVEIRIAVKNTGTAPARAVKLSVKTAKLAGVQVFGDQAFELGDIPAGAFTECSFAVSIKPTFTGERVAITAEASERSDFAVTTSADLSQSIGEPATQQVLEVDKVVYIPKSAALLSGASKTARRVGTVPGGANLRANGELGQFVRVEYKTGKGLKRLAWILRGNTAAPKTVADASSKTVKSAGVVVEYARIPPIIVMTSPKNGDRLQIEEEKLAFNAVIQDPDSTLSNITLSINGRPWRNFLSNGQVVKSDTRGIGGVKRAPKANETGSAKGPKSFDVNTQIPLSFGENQLTLTVRDSDGETATAQATVVRKQRTGRVFALIVGVNTYKDKNITGLNYAEADAKAFAKFLRENPRSLVSDPSHVKLLTGADATRTAIVKELDNHLVKQATRPEDTAIFFYAGHGYSDGKRTFLTGSDSQLASLRATALAQSDLQSYWSDIRAERKLLFADACHSGGLQGLRGENTVSLGLSSLGKQAEKGRGSVTILAAQPKQLSVESEKLGHGVFTQAVLDGLNGKADRNNDGRVAVSELVVFLDTEVPALAKQKGQNQNPLHSISGGRGEIVLTR